MIVQLRVPDELYEAYARRNPEDPRAAMAESLAKFEKLDPKEDRLVLDKEALKALQAFVQGDLSEAKSLIDFVKRTTAVSAAGIELPLSVAVRTRLAAEARALEQPYDVYAKQQLSLAVTKILGV